MYLFTFILTIEREEQDYPWEKIIPSIRLQSWPQRLTRFSMKILWNSSWILNFKRCLLGLLFLAQALWAGSYVAGEGHFSSKEGDSLSFIKSQLLYNAFRDVISKELKSMKLDDRKFWRNYEEKFSQQFEPTAKALKKSFSNKKNRKSKKTTYKSSLRVKRLTAQRCLWKS